MVTFFIGLVILMLGGALYEKLCERVMKPTERETPAVAMRDDVDFVPMSKWKNSLIELLNIAGTGPILGPIQGILFGPVAFITIPIGCVIGGAVHDYMTGMILVRNKGEQMPDLIRRFLGKQMRCFWHSAFLPSWACSLSGQREIRQVLTLSGGIFPGQMRRQRSLPLR